ncbi:MAG: hypothetical protein WCD11_02055 [Solirubrobacteraceae bacterium]
MSVPKLDLTQFTSLNDALSKVEPGDRYVNLGRELIPYADRIEFTPTAMFWFTMITRSQGLHAAIARETREHNPIAVFPLIRAFAESVVMVIYVLDHPEYVEAISAPPDERSKGGPRRKTMQALISHATDQAPGVKAVYKQLSEVTHFGSIAMWMPHRITVESESILRTTWSSEPEWKNDEQALIACAQTLELADAMCIYLHNFAGRHIVSTATAPRSGT